MPQDEQQTEKTLAHRMRDKAVQARRLSPDLYRELMAHADALDSLDMSTPIPTFVATWAKARKFWCDLTGESLV